MGAQAPFLTEIEMTIGLSGSHRTGKSTLAKAFAEKNAEFNFVETSAVGVYKALGLDPKVMYPFAKRLEIQRHILDAVAQQYSDAGLLFVADRTPIDFIAYTLADIMRDNYDGSSDSEITKYINDCYDVANTYFSMIMVVQPGIEIVEAEYKCPTNVGYVEHINNLVLGLATDRRLNSMHFALNRDVTDLGARVTAVENMVNMCKARVSSREGVKIYH